MSNPSVPGGNTPGASGAGDNSDTSDSSKSTDKVDYETHRKLLGEKKRLAEVHAAAQAELERYRKAEEDRQLKEAEAAKDYERLKAQYADQLKAKEAELSQMRNERIEAQKLDAFFGSLDGKLERKYWGLIDTSSIIIDPVTSQPDPMSVTKYLEQFRKEYPEVILKAGRPSMPQEKPLGNGGGSLTLEEWKALPLKEKKARITDVKRN